MTITYCTYITCISCVSHACDHHTICHVTCMWLYSPPVSPLGTVNVSPAALVANESDVVNLSCAAEGGPNNTLMWLFDGTPINSSAFLTVTVSTAVDGGVYSCQVSNDAGSGSNSGRVFGRLNVRMFTVLPTQVSWVSPGTVLPTQVSWVSPGTVHTTQVSWVSPSWVSPGTVLPTQVSWVSPGTVLPTQVSWVSPSTVLTTQVSWVSPGTVLPTQVS